MAADLLICHLHGINGTHNGQQTNTVPASHEAAVAAGVIEPCLIVFPDGYGDSFWADSVNSAKPAETNVKLELIPYLDANYRTVADRSRRVIQGFSMGGFGAAKFATKFPDTFGACVIYDGAMLTWPQVQQRHATQAAEIFNSSAATFDLYSPWYWLTQNAATLRVALPFRDSVGALLDNNRAWRDALVAQSIAPAYVETGCAHTLGCLLDTQGSNSWAFIAAAFASATDSLRLNLRAQGRDVRLDWSSIPGQRFMVLHRPTLQTNLSWAVLATDWPASSPGTNSVFIHTNALFAPAGFYRVGRLP